MAAQSVSAHQAPVWPGQELEAEEIMIPNILEIMARLQRQINVSCLIAVLLGIAGVVLHTMFEGMWVILSGVSIGVALTCLALAIRVRRETNKFLDAWSDIRIP
ncbi:hypothetical protein [Streptomyces sp. NPDC006477]|uniref:hypothetical protein n=1 Tax=Streptomyces sp. NPDC006477 TaxID=3364747 RepID=UPI0036C1A236